MELIVAVPALAGPGGPQSYALTVAEHLAQLGHGVTLYAPVLGALADVARSRSLDVAGDLDALPAAVDGVLSGADRSLACALAERYPGAARAFVVHGIYDSHLPPPAAGVVHATVALNDRFVAAAAAVPGAGEVVRLAQPVDMRRFSVRRPLEAPPLAVLLLGNYHGDFNSRALVLQEAWAGAGLRWDRVGHPEPQLDVAPAMHDVDIVVGYGRSMVEAMASGRAAYVFDHAGADRWVTPASYPEIEAHGFSGMAPSVPPPDAATLRADLDAYDPAFGLAAYDLVRAHHDARGHAAALVALLERLPCTAAPYEADDLRALTRLTATLRRVEAERDDNRQEARQWHVRAEELAAQLEALDARLNAAEHRAAEARAHAEGVEERLAALRATRRFRFADRLGRVAERLRGGR